MKYLLLLLLIPLIIWIYTKYQYTTRQKLRILAVDVIPVLNKYNVEYWVDFGTLLGIIRENDIILGDEDVDIVLVDNPILKDQMSLVSIDLEKMGYKLKKEDWRAYRIFNGGLYADLYINKMGEQEYIGATGETSNIPYSLIGNPQYIKWNGIDVRVPEHIHETLTFRHGNWQVPKHGFKGRNP